ncbi:hypothetical protein HETIRDRAFT_232716, partial [Heterobasidion irregulare TC 32-1]
PPQPPPPTELLTSENSAPTPAIVIELQFRLQDIQVSLACFIDKIRAMEGMLSEHKAIKREVSTLRELIKEKCELDSVRGRQCSGTLRAKDHDDSEYGGDDDDAQSIATVMPH